jgi:copper resistance protein B
MDMSDMDHGAMAMPGMQAPADLPADAAPRTPIPAVTGADRAAAFMPLGAGHPAHDKRSNSFWLVDRLEVADTAKSGGWEGLAWIGGDVHRTWLRTEGDVEDGRVEQGNLEVLYGRSVTPWWDLVAGVRQDVGEGPDRTWAAFGVQGLAPYKFEVEATAYISGSGRTAATLEAEYDTLLTNRLILQWQGEANLYRKSDPARGHGSGRSTVEAGARLRYEITRRFAPYIGVEVERAFGETARLRRDDGFDATDTRVVAGIRFWF